MAYFERDILDQSKVVELNSGESGGPTVRLAPADAPSIMLGDGRDYGTGSNATNGFSWRPTFIVTGLVLIAFLAAAFL
jgi:hypothetical protein